MHIPLDSFESHIDETILKRGLDYWRKGYVETPEEVSSGHWEAYVQGTEEYTVKIHLKKGVMHDYSCDCPYDLGPVCKHVTAVLFAVQEERLSGLKETSKRKKTDGKTNPRKPGEKEQQEELLKKLNKENLSDFIRNTGESDRNFRRMFIALFSNLLENYGSEDYAKYIRSILKTNAGREGFLDYRTAIKAANQVDELMDKAIKHFDTGNFETAFHISMAVLKEMEDALDYADDSDGSISGCITNATDLLFHLAEAKIPELFRAEMFKQALAYISDCGYNGYDWHTDMLQLAANLVVSKEELNSFNSMISKINVSEYGQGSIASIRIELLQRFEGSDDAEKYSESQLHLPEIRRAAIGKALNEKDYLQVNKLAEDGIKLARQKNHHGLVNIWMEWQLKAAEEKKNKSEILKLAHRLFLDGQQEMKYLDLMQKQAKSNQWPGIIQQIIADLKKNGKRIGWSTNVLPRIYFREEMWHDLLKYLSNKPSLHQLEKYENPLAKHFPAELSQLYEEAICEHADQSNGRNDYETTARYLRRMKNLGFKKDVDLIIVALKEKYSKRRALLEELDKV